MFQELVVLNLTPDSFSDGGSYQNWKQLQQQIEFHKDNNINRFDIGAESTAPFNAPISIEEEWSRLEDLFFNYYDKFNFSQNDTLSFDTYKPEVMEMVLGFFAAKRDAPQLVWNDVSGLFDEKIINILKNNPSLDYIHSHNYAPSREETSHHMNYVKDLDGPSLTEDVIDNFQKVREKVERLGLKNKIVFDPCFGFSKSLEQNYQLIRNFPKICSHFGLKVHWMVGISRKSFLKNLCQGDDPGFIGREVAQVLILQYWGNSLSGNNVMVRLHDPRIINTLAQCQKMLL